MQNVTYPFMCVSTPLFQDITYTLNMLMQYVLENLRAMVQHYLALRVELEARRSHIGNAR